MVEQFLLQNASAGKGPCASKSTGKAFLDFVCVLEIILIDLSPTFMLVEEIVFYSTTSLKVEMNSGLAIGRILAV